MNHKLAAACLVTMLLALSVSLRVEAQMPKEGDLAWKHYLTGTFKATKVSDDLLLVTSENHGPIVSDSQAGPFHELSGRCANQILYVKGVGRNQGHCVFVDRAGDQWVVEFSAPAQKLGATSTDGTAKFVGGTGKFAGITGEGQYTYTALRSLPDGTFQGYSTFKGRYRLE
jgi:hypothetical protein